MQRDKRGRFVKKAQEGTVLNEDSLIANGKKYKLKPGVFLPTDIHTMDLNNADILDEVINQYFDQVDEPVTTTNDTSTSRTVPAVKSAGMVLTGNNTNTRSKSSLYNPINKTKLANFLELTRAGIGASVNNKIADRALSAEKPFVQDVSESHRSVYGDYRAQVQGEKAAAQLRNMASKPITSDGALQQQMMMDAQIKGQQYIDQGNAQDEALIKQTRETAWQQEKENQQQRQAAAMQNRRTMLMSEKNKAQIRNMRDSANFSQVVSPLLSATEQRLRNKGVQQDYYQDYYNDALVKSDVYANFRDGLSDTRNNVWKFSSI